ncbi:Hypothetical protein NTJ_00060 [Nesidiocoris tenuis]|uniref:Uncharacterized protein n=1 Tax=Nesidiocoris tenuis TaxID=355587 RepID=A0ABN7A807_9HEMI|nr:Hypothetical protein NTJ_00060 [Nesidiocoris tenuis]
MNHGGEEAISGSTLENNEWEDSEGSDCELTTEEMLRQRERFKEIIRRRVDSIIRSQGCSSVQDFDQTVIKLRSKNTLTTYPLTPAHAVEMEDFIQ